MSQYEAHVSAADLAAFDEEYREAQVEEREREDVPDGTYQVAVEKAEMTRARNSGRPMLKWTLRILGPSQANRVLWRHNVIATPDNIRWLKQDLATCGLVLDKLSELPARLGELLDVKLEVAKRTRGDNTNVYLNRRIVMDTPPDDNYRARAAEALGTF